MGTSIPSTIECRTPLLSPTPGLGTMPEAEADEFQNRVHTRDFHGAEMNDMSRATDSTLRNEDSRMNLNIDQTRNLIFSNLDIHSFEISYSPLPPQSLLVPKKLFASITSYYSGMFTVDVRSIPVEKSSASFALAKLVPISCRKSHSLRAVNAYLTLSTSFIKSFEIKLRKHCHSCCFYLSF